MAILTRDRKEWYVADFETATKKTEYYKNRKDTRVILAGLQKFGKYDAEIEKFVSIEQFFKRVFDSKSKTVWFHNLSFDGDFIIKYLVNELNFTIKTVAEKANELQIFKQGNRLYYLKVVYRYKRQLRKIYFRCSYLLLNSPIKSLGKDIQIEKYKDGQENDNFYNLEPVERLEDLPKDFLEYLERDITIANIALNNLETAISSAKTVKYYNLKNKSPFNIYNKLTIGSIAYSMLKKIYLPEFNNRTGLDIKLKIIRFITFVRKI